MPDSTHSPLQHFWPVPQQPAPQTCPLGHPSQAHVSVLYSSPGAHEWGSSASTFSTQSLPEQVWQAGQVIG